VLISFEFKPENLLALRRQIFELVHWGFDYESLVSVPLDEFQEYGKLLVRHYEEKREAERNASNSSGKSRPEPKMVGRSLH
jgi:hypothetical protein